MKFIVDEMPITETGCPFFTNGKCDIGYCMCDRFDKRGYVVDRDAKECAMLKEQSDGKE